MNRALIRAEKIGLCTASLKRYCVGEHNRSNSRHLRRKAYGDPWVAVFIFPVAKRS